MSIPNGWVQDKRRVSWAKTQSAVKKALKRHLTGKFEMNTEIRRLDLSVETMLRVYNEAVGNLGVTLDPTTIYDLVEAETVYDMVQGLYDEVNQDG